MNEFISHKPRQDYDFERHLERHLANPLINGEFEEDDLAPRIEDYDTVDAFRDATDKYDTEMEQVVDQIVAADDLDMARALESATFRKVAILKILGNRAVKSDDLDMARGIAETTGDDTAVIRILASRDKELKES